MHFIELRCTRILFHLKKPFFAITEYVVLLAFLSGLIILALGLLKLGNT